MSLIRWIWTPGRRGTIGYAILCLSIAGAFAGLVDERNDRKTDQCTAEHQEQVDERAAEIEDYRLLPAYIEFFSDPNNKLFEIAREKTKKDLHGRYGNNRIPNYCEQHTWPEDTRKWPEELK